MSSGSVSEQETRHRNQAAAMREARVMPQYLVCNYIPDDFTPSTVTEAMIGEIRALNH